MIPGTVEKLWVDREAPFGYFLTNEVEDVLLHHSEAPEGIELDDEIEVFLYQDHEGRLAATPKIPVIQQGAFGWAEVAGVKSNLGVFIDIGLSKDILVSLDDLPELETLWPKEGDRLYCSLKTDKRGRLLGQLGREEEMRALSVKATREAFNKNITGTVYKLLMAGSFLLTDEGYIGFIHESERGKEPRLGQRVEGRVIDVKEDGSVNVSLLPRSFEKQDEDADKIFGYLESRGGKMPYWDKSLPEEIEKRFGMSKAAFKRALGKLMKEKKIVQKDGWTSLPDRES